MMNRWLIPCVEIEKREEEKKAVNDVTEEFPSANSNMRLLSNLVPCGGRGKVRGKEVVIKPPARPPMRTGRDHSVLLTVVGETYPPPVQNFQKLEDLCNPAAMDQIVGDPIPVMDGAMAMEEETTPDCPEIEDDGQSPIKVNSYMNISSKQLKDVAKSREYWHKFIILRGAGYTKLEIMRAVFSHISPCWLTPFQYSREGSSVAFLARNCLPALSRLLLKRSPLRVEVSGPIGPEVHFLEIEVILRYTHIEEISVSYYEHLQNCLAKRYDKNLRMLDLSAFHEDPDLGDETFWPLWVPKVFVFVRNCVQSKYSNTRWLNLSNNELVEVPVIFPEKLEILDLSSNKIRDLQGLNEFQGMHLLEINLDRNPLCANYVDERTYILSLRDFFPYIKKIDNVYLSRPDLPVWRRHFVPLGLPECVALVDQFLQHFFTLLDGDDRQRLRGMYHPEAMFSLTCNYVPGQSTSSTARLTRYTLESRNLLKMSDYSKSQQLLSYGAEEVLAALGRLPRTEHDPYSFAVDMPYFTNDVSLIVVNGVFREPSMMNENLIRAFSRTFVLRKVAGKEYQIVNEMLTVSNASTKQAEESFQYPRPKVSLAKLSFNPAQDLTDADRQQMTKILSRLTEMNQHWSRKCLEESKWDIKEALLVFTEMLKMNKLPGEAFKNEDDTSEKK